MDDSLSALPPDDGAVAALVNVTSTATGSGASLAQIAVAAAAAVGAAGAVLWIPGGHGEAEVAAAPGTESAVAAAVAAELEVLTGGGVPEDELVGAGDAAGAVGRVARAFGSAGAVIVPVPVGEVPGAVLALDCPEWGQLHPLRRHAVRVAAARAGGVIEAGRLRYDLERIMEQILLTDERMLGRMGLDIHDGPTQQLSVALLEVQLLEAELADGSESDQPTLATIRPALGRIYETVGGALHEMRELIGHLRPAQFEDRRLSDILQDAINDFERRSDLSVSAVWHGEFPVNGVSITQRITLYRILQETLTNAHRHGAASAVRVTVTASAAGVDLEVRDNGSGFDVDDAAQGAGQALARFGLNGMRNRTQILGGSFSVTSEVGAGTTVRVFLPRWGDADPAS